MNQTITQNSPYLTKLNAYLKERFPLINGILFLIFFLTSYIFTSYLEGKEVGFTSELLFGFIAVYLFFFKLRVFDEHKDYLKDCINHPQRVLQKGLISLDQLRNIAIAGTVIEASISLWFGTDTFFLYLIVLGYSLIMAKEFFVRDWLEKKLFLYALTHMMIMPLMVLWVASMATKSRILPEDVIYLCFLSFFSGFAFEISRKIKSPEEERSTILTYSKIFGTRKAPFMALLCHFASAWLMIRILNLLDTSQIPFILIGVLLLTISSCYMAFSFKPSPKKAKVLELSSSLFMLISYLIIITLIILK
jgi:4-hydroxybenzoate polyprenyltransferase